MMKMTLKEHIQGINAKSLEWLAENPTGFVTTLEEDPEYWAEMGITTVDQFERDMLISDISDISKEKNGMRLRLDWKSHTTEELQEIYDRLVSTPSYV